jgi:tetratricopeptide (TPR) repeat protein
MADQDLSVTIPAYVAGAHIVAHRIPTTSEIFPADRQEEALQRLIDQDAFYRSRYLTAETIAILERYQVGYLVVASGSNLDIQLRLASQWFEWLLDDQSYSLFAVRQAPPMTNSIAGNTALAERNWAEAERAYRAELRNDPGSLLAMTGLAEIAHARGQFGEALRIYDTAVAEADLPVLHYRLGQLNLELGQIEQSIAEFDQAQAAAPAIGRFHVALGDVCLSAGREECAAEQYAAAVANRNLPGEAAYRIALADLWRQRGRTDRALALYEEAVALQTSEANQLMLASAYQEERHFEQAEALLKMLRAQRPLSVEVLTLTAEVKAAQGLYDDAERFYRRAISLLEWTGRESADTRLAMAHTLMTANRVEDAQTEIDRAIAMQPNNAAAYSLQGELYSRRYEADKSTVAYQQAFRLDPTQVQLYLALSNQFRQRGGQQDDVLNLLQTAMRANPDEAVLALALGDQLQRRGDTTAAVDAYQAALDMFELYPVSGALNLRTMDTSRAFALVSLARVSEDLGEMEPAMNYYGAAVAAAPNLAWTQVVYGDALRRRNELAGAETAYRRAITSDPTFASAYVQLADLLRARGNVVEAKAMEQQALEAAMEQSAQAAAESRPPGLALSAPNILALDEAALTRSFASDALTAEAQPVAFPQQSTVDQIIAQLALDGADKFNGDAGANVLHLLTRLSPAGAQTTLIKDLYLQILQRGQQEGWYPVAMAHYHKGLGDLYLASNEPELAVEAYRNAVQLDDWWPQARLGLARALEEVGNEDEALGQLRRAVDMAPGFVEAQVALAVALDKRNEADAAFDVYRMTATAHPGNPRATLALARAWQDRGDWENAEHYYRMTVALNPGEATAYVDLAALLLTQARYDEAEPLLQSAMQIDKANANVYVQMGVLEEQRGNGGAAQEWFKRADAVRQEGQPVNLVLIDLLQRYAHYDMSMLFVQEALKLHPDDPELLLRQARFQRVQGLYSEAMSTLLSAARLALSDSRLSVELGELYVTQGRPQAAVAVFRQTVTLDPAEATYYVRLAELWSSQAMYQQAESLLQSGLKRVRDQAPLYAALADLYVRQSKTDDAKAILERGLQDAGDRTELLLAMGAYLESRAVQTGGGDEATEQWYNTALGRQPDNAALHAALGAHYLRRDRSADAVAHYERAIALEPGNASHYVAAAGAYVAAGRTADAEAAYQRALHLEPTLVDGYIGLGGLLQTAQRWDEAQAVYDRGLAVAPTDGELYIAYCAFVLARGDQTGGLDLLDRAEQVAPTAAMYVARAHLYSGLGRRDAALVDLQAALAKEPGSIDAAIALGDLYREMGDTANAKRVYDGASISAPALQAPPKLLFRRR